VSEQTNILNCKRGDHPEGHRGQIYGLCLACERDLLRRELAEAQATASARGALLDSYVLGGWVDAERLARELAEARELLSTSHTDGLHWKTWRQWRERKAAFLGAAMTETSTNPTQISSGLVGERNKQACFVETATGEPMPRCDNYPRCPCGGPEGWKP
jgi:hypothetical protein